MARHGKWLGPLLASGLVLLFAGERIVGTGTGRMGLAVASAVAVLAAMAGRIHLWVRALGEARRAESALLWGYVGVASGLCMYALSTREAADLIGTEPAGSLEAILAVAWPAVTLVSVLTVLAMELSYRRMPLAHGVEIRRIHNTAFDALSVGFALVFVLSVNYVASARNIRRDLTYLKATKASDSTLRMVGGLDEAVKVYLFFPEVNEVLDLVRPYFDQIDATSDKLAVQVVDQALAQRLARDFGVPRNGHVVVVKGEGPARRHMSFDLGEDLESARGRLKKLDGRFQEAFMGAARVARSIHFTVGHEERSVEGEPGDGQGLRGLKTVLARSNVKVVDLGFNEGLARAVPDDAPVVAVVGPRKPFLPEEAQSLIAYVRRGGRLLVMVEPEVEHGLTPLFDALALTVLPGVVNSESQFLRRTHTPADHAIVHTSLFSSHPTVTLATRNAAQVASIFVSAAGLTQKDDATPKGVEVQFPIRGEAQFFRDLDGDYERDSQEGWEMVNLMAAVTVKAAANGEEGRAVVIGDGDFATDQVLRNPGNALVIGDVLQWFLGEEQIVGATATEEDVRIEHTREQDKAWFYGTSFGVPLPILGLGFWVATRRRRSRLGAMEETPLASGETQGGKGKAA